MTALYHPRPERWSQVSLKGFFVLVTVLCVSLGWLGAQVKWVRDRHEALKWTEQHEAEFNGWVLNNPLPWSLRVLGEKEYQAIPIDGRNLSGEDQVRVEELKKLFPEATILVR